MADVEPQGELVSGLTENTKTGSVSKMAQTSPSRLFTRSNAQNSCRRLGRYLTRRAATGIDEVGFAHSSTRGMMGLRVCEVNVLK